MHIGIAAPISVDQLNVILNKKRTDLPPGLGGIAVNNIINGLWEKGHTVSVFCLDPSLNEPLIVHEDRLNVFVAPYRRRARERALDFFKVERNYLRRFIEGSTVEIVHAHWTYEYALAAMDSGKPYLVSAHDSPLKILLYTPTLYRLIKALMALHVLKSAKNLTAVSPYIQQQLTPWTKKSIDVIPNLIPRNWFDPKIHKSYPKPIKLISINNGWSKLKNVDTAILAFSLVRQKYPQITLELFGKDYAQGEAAYQWAKGKGLLSGLSFSGYVKSSTLETIFGNYDILLHTSREEACSTVVLEAMAKGLVVVAGEKSGGIPWQLNYGNAGVLTNISDAQSVAKGIANLISNEQSVQALSHQSLEHCYANFHPDVIVPKWEEKYSRILSN